MNWADTSSSLEDANLNYDLTRGRRIVQIKGGQFKVPFGRQELTSSGSQQFVDRSIVTNEFALGRDTGLQVWGEILNGTIEWRTGMFNGNGRNRSSNDNDKFQFNARVTWQPLGDVKYSESDFESSSRPLFAVAAQYEANNLQDLDPNTDAIDREVFGGDVVFKFKGVSVFGEYFRRVSEPEIAVDFETRGWATQVGWFVYRRHVEVALRFATLEFAGAPSSLVSAKNSDRNERGVALNWFLNKHALKLQADLRRIENEVTDLADDEARLQMQFIF
jgi:hypothetical protein